MEQPQTGTETPAPPMTLRQHIEAEAEPRTDPVVDDKAPPAPAVGDTKPEEEAASTKPDAEVSEAARTLRKSRADERKAKIQREIDESVREREQTRAELARERAELESIRQERAQLARGEQPRRPATAGASPVTDPNDPRPTSEQFASWDEYEVARDEWLFREGARRAEHTTRARLAREAQERDTTTTAKTLDEQAAAVREKYADFDAAIDTVLTKLQGNPRARDVAAFMAASGVGGEIGYRLGKDAAAMQAVLEAQSPTLLGAALERLAAQITASLKAPKPVTRAPSPPSQTVGGSAAASEIDTAKGVSTRDHFRIENAEIAERRRRGLRN